MSRLSKEECARFSGAEWLLRLVKEKGIEEAEKELTQRGVRDIPLMVKKSDVDELYIKERCNIILCLTLVAAVTLHDEFDFEVDELNRFIKMFNSTADCLTKDYVSWKNLQQIIQKETGILIPLPERE